MMGVFHCSLSCIKRQGISVLDLVFETEKNDMLKPSLLRTFLKFIEISSSYGGNLYVSDENIVFPMVQGKMYMHFSLIFQDEYSLMEFVKAISNYRF